jgi:AcrR family transcriptional regulator
VSKGAETRREIVEEALTLAGTVGLEGVSLGTLAERLKLSKSGLFAHFRSKEALQLEVVQSAIQSFVSEVVLPALTKARGEPRLRALFDRYIGWIRGRPGSGGCVFISLSQEYDDRPGPVRDRLVRSQRDWYATLERATRIAIDEGHLAKDIDTQRFAFEVVGIGMSFQQAHRLLANPHAEMYARDAFEALLARHRSSPKRSH